MRNNALAKSPPAAKRAGLETFGSKYFCERKVFNLSSFR
jgi:hypothetical protein